MVNTETEAVLSLPHDGDDGEIYYLLASAIIVADAGECHVSARGWNWNAIESNRVESSYVESLIAHSMTLPRGIVSFSGTDFVTWVVFGLGSHIDLVDHVTGYLMVHHSS